MEHTSHSRSAHVVGEGHLRLPSAFIAATFLAIAILALLGATGAGRAAAAWEQVGTFGEGPEIQLGGVGDMAVNVDGSGGVAPGTFYTVGETNEGVRVARFSPSGQFELAWDISGTPGTPVRCGNVEGLPPCAARPSETVGRSGVDLNQATGAVYVFNKGAGVGKPTVSVYGPDGSKEISTRFAIRASESETAAEFPAKVHGSLYPGPLAVNDAGEVFLFDVNFADSFYHRLMRFKPKTPGDFSEYEYAGPGQDIGAGTTGSWPSEPALDAAGNVYVSGSGSDFIEKYDPTQPSTPVCTFTLKAGGITGFAVNPDSGEVFYYTYKNKQIHQLSPCTAGTFAPTGQAIAVAPERDDLYAMAVNPDLERLYGIAPTAVPGSGFGKGEPGKTALGYIFAPVSEAPPVVESVAVLRTSETTAELQATVNPKGFQTRYAFEYMTRAAYEEAGEEFIGASEAPPGGAVAGSGQSPVSVVAILSGLVPDTEYVYRAAVESHCSPSKPEEVCEDAGEAQSFTTAPVGASLVPDGRAYELVSPAEKHSGQVLPADPATKSCPEVECKPGRLNTHFPMQSAPDGNAVVYEGNSFGPGEGAVVENQYLARRGPGGWQSANLTPFNLFSSAEQGYKLFDAGLTQGLLEQTKPALTSDAPTDFTNLYSQPTAAPAALSPLLTGANSFIHRAPGNSAGKLALALAGASADLSRIFFEANDALTSEAGEGGEPTNLYEWRNGALTQVNLAAGSQAPAPGAVLGSGTLLQSGNPNNPSAVYTHAISTDGSRAFWTGADGKTYVRVDGLGTLEVPGPGSCKASLALALRTCFLTASDDGSRVLLSDGQLYEFDEGAGAYEPSADLSAGKGGFQGIIGQSEDLSHIYFVLDPAGGVEALTKGTGDVSQGSATITDVKATSGAFTVGQVIEGAGIPAGTTILALGAGTLEISAAATASGEDVALSAGNPLGAGEENSEGAKPKVSGFNLYAWDEGTTSFVATLVEADNQDFGDWQASPSSRSAEASPGGRYVAFLSGAPLTGYDNSAGGQPVSEVFLYDSASGELGCPSCNPGNAVALGPSVLRRILAVKGSLPQPRYLTDSGRLYFDSQDALVPADTNGRSEDVYQYEPQGVGSCTREGGCVGLISGGVAATDSNLLAIDASGDNVFFTTRERLVGADTDEQIDLYDARVGGVRDGSSPAPGECQGEACQPTLPPPAREPTAASPSFTGAGNLKPKKGCKKGQVKRKGKCVKRPKHKRHVRKAAKQRGGSR